MYLSSLIVITRHCDRDAIYWSRINEIKLRIKIPKIHKPSCRTLPQMDCNWLIKSYVNGFWQPDSTFAIRRSCKQVRNSISDSQSRTYAPSLRVNSMHFREWTCGRGASVMTRIGCTYLQCLPCKRSFSSSDCSKSVGLVNNWIAVVSAADWTCDMKPIPQTLWLFCPQLIL